MSSIQSALAAKVERRAVLVLITLVVVRTGGLVPLGHAAVSLAVAALEVVGCLAAGAVAVAVVVLAVRLASARADCIRIVYVHSHGAAEQVSATVHVITDAELPRVPDPVGGR